MSSQNEENSAYSNFGKQDLVGSLATVAFVSGEKLLNKFTKYPPLAFGLGMIGGVLVYKNRKVIIANTDRVVTAGKNTFLHQKGKALDLVAEAKEERALLKIMFRFCENTLIHWEGNYLSYS